MPATEIPTPDPRTLDEASRPFAEAVSAQFAIKRLIGRGGMGMVFLARDRRLDRLVAIKTLPRELAKDPSVRERFLRETRTAGQMAHPNIVPIFGADEADGHVYFVMSYVEGDSLASRVRAQGRIEPRIAARYLHDVAAALAHAHARGTIHRDVKAENILIDRASDRAMVTDFGIARVAEATPLTVTGQVLGTVYYVSPEQVSGDVLDARSDIYSLGVVGFLMLTGRFPFEGDVASAVLVAHVTRSAPPISSVSTHVPAARAADLQANTGLVPRPDPVVRPRDPERDRARSKGYGVSHVREAAGEAGIDPRYVEHALLEHGITPEGKAIVAPAARPAGAPSVPGPSPTKIVPPEPARQRWIPRPWVRTAKEIIFEAEIEGEMPSRDVERLVNLLRDETGHMGTTVAKTRELAWFAGGLGNQWVVSVVPLATRTEIRLTRGARRYAVLAKLGAWVFSAFAVAPLSAVFLMETMLQGPDEEFGVMFGIGLGVVTAVKLGRALARGVAVRMEARVRRLGERLEDKVRQSIATIARR